MRTVPITSIAVAAALVLLSACGADDDALVDPGEVGVEVVAPTAPPPIVTTEAVPLDEPPLPMGEPPDIEVFGSNGTLALRPYTYCWTQEFGDESVGICADGEWPDPLPSAGTTNGQVTFLFPVDGWSFTAHGGPPDAEPDRPLTVTEVRDGKWAVELDGVLGPSIVSVSGFGPEGDVHVAFTVELLSGVDDG